MTTTITVDWVAVLQYGALVILPPVSIRLLRGYDVPATWRDLLGIAGLIATGILLVVILQGGSR